MSAEDINAIITDMMSYEPDAAWSFAEVLTYDLAMVEAVMRALVAAYPSSDDRVAAPREAIEQMESSC